MKRAKKFSKKAVIEFIRTYCLCVTNDEFVNYEWSNDTTCRLYFAHMIYSSVLSNLPSNWEYYVAYTYRDGSKVCLTIFDSCL